LFIEAGYAKAGLEADRTARPLRDDGYSPQGGPPFEAFDRCISAWRTNRKVPTRNSRSGPWDSAGYFRRHPWRERIDQIQQADRVAEVAKPDEKILKIEILNVKIKNRLSRPRNPRMSWFLNLKFKI